MKKIAVLSLTFACALAFGGAALPDSDSQIQDRLRTNLDRLEMLSTSYDLENPEQVLLGDDYALLYNDGAYSIFEREQNYTNRKAQRNTTQRGLTENISNTENNVPNRNNATPNRRGERRTSGDKTGINEEENTSPRINSDLNDSTITLPNQNNSNNSRANNYNQQRNNIAGNNSNQNARNNANLNQNNTNLPQNSVNTTQNTNQNSSRFDNNTSQNNGNNILNQNPDVVNNMRSNNPTLDSMVKTNNIDTYRNDTNMYGGYANNQANYGYAQNGLFNGNMSEQNANFNSNMGERSNLNNSTNPNTLNNSGINDSNTYNSTTNNSRINNSNNSTNLNSNDIGNANQNNSVRTLPAATAANQAYTDTIRKYSPTLTSTGEALADNIEKVRTELNRSTPFIQKEIRALRAYTHTLSLINKKLAYGQKELFKNLTRMSILQNSSGVEENALNACYLDTKIVLENRITLLNGANQAVEQINLILKESDSNNNQNNTNPNQNNGKTIQNNTNTAQNNVNAPSTTRKDHLNQNNSQNINQGESTGNPERRSQSNTSNSNLQNNSGASINNSTSQNTQPRTDNSDTSRSQTTTPNVSNLNNNQNASPDSRSSNSIKNNPTQNNNLSNQDTSNSNQRQIGNNNSSITRTTPDSVNYPNTVSNRIPQSEIAPTILSSDSKTTDNNTESYSRSSTTSAELNDCPLS